MIPERTISKSAARRFLVTRHLLAPPRSLPSEPGSVMRVVARLGSLQFDPLEVAGRNHDLVLLARIAGYERAWTESLLYEGRQLFEAYNKGLSLLPTSELPWYQYTWDRSRARLEGDTFVEHAGLVAELLGRIRDEGPLSSTDVEPRAAIDWYWRPTNQVRAILEALAQAGILGLVRREGNRRVYDLAERLFPADVLAERRPEREQQRHRLLSRYRGHGLLGRSGSAEVMIGIAPGRPSPAWPAGTATRGELLADLIEDGSLVPVGVEGVRGERFVLAEELATLDRAERDATADATAGGSARPEAAAPGVAFIAPLDPLVWDRQALRSIFGFDYLWEVYVPAARRRWGYYVLPILFGDRFVGRIEPRIDRRTGTLRVLGLWWEDGFDPLAEPGFVAAFSAALDAHRRFGHVKRVVLPRVARHRALVSAVRSVLD
ncbi:MAG: winged helix DNA-binding domain-containing protein [Chloroflexota bacterium]|nr:winged helix DNA-binding domain-containing protein [Chloroflexota bacterium]